MTLTPLFSLESARKKFLMNTTYIMSRKWESGLLSPKTFDSHFQHMMYVRVHQKFFLADSCEQSGVRVISVS